VAEGFTETVAEIKSLSTRVTLVFSAGWAIVLLGTLHMFAATTLFSGLTGAAMWFVSGGIAMVLAGALNLLNHACGAIAPGLRRVCMGANIVMTVFAMVPAS
jgi:hypothetical protein